MLRFILTENLGNMQTKKMHASMHFCYFFRILTISLSNVTQSYECVKTELGTSVLVNVQQFAGKPVQPKIYYSAVFAIGWYEIKIFVVLACADFFTPVQFYLV